MDTFNARRRREVLRSGLLVGAAGLAGCSSLTETLSGSDTPSSTGVSCPPDDVAEYREQADTRREVYRKYARLYSPAEQTGGVADEVLPDLKSLIPTPRIVDAIEQAQSFSESAEMSIAAQILRQGSYEASFGAEASSDEHEEATETNQELAARAGEVVDAADAYVDEPTESNSEALVAALRSERERLAETPEIREWSTIEAGKYPSAQGVLYDDGAGYIREFATANLETLQSYRSDIASQLTCFDVESGTESTPTASRTETDTPSDPDSSPNIDGFEDGTAADWDPDPALESSFEASEERAAEGSWSAKFIEGASDGTPTWERVGRTVQYEQVETAHALANGEIYADSFTEWRNGDDVVLRVNYNWSNNFAAVNGQGAQPADIEEGAVVADLPWPSSDRFVGVTLDDIDWDRNVVGTVLVNGTEQATDVPFFTEADGIDRTSVYIAGNGGNVMFVDESTVPPE